jgi:hypothetical protein
MAAKPTMSRALREQLSRAMKRHAEAFRAYGSQGGKVRATRLSGEERQAIARNAAEARWSAHRRGTKGK